MGGRASPRRTAGRRRYRPANANVDAQGLAPPSPRRGPGDRRPNRPAQPRSATASGPARAGLSEQWNRCRHAQTRRAAAGRKAGRQVVARHAERQRPGPGLRGRSAGNGQPARGACCRGCARPAVGRATGVRGRCRDRPQRRTGHARRPARRNRAGAPPVRHHRACAGSGPPGRDRGARRTVDRRHRTLTLTSLTTNPGGEMRGNENVLDGTDDVMDELKKLVTELTDLPAGALTSAASLATDLGLDDLAVAQILVEAELRFGVQIPDRIVRPGLQELADYIRAEARKENT
ncbi:hypothetical protein FDZ84_25565 [Saccharopolyspora sp. ASAGF58]|nr:hypothetical protein FDZ84_25565 [Saccharopolyspora sp. ASAGF58]